MKYLTITLTLLSILYACSYEVREYADIIFLDGVIYTSNSAQEVVDSFAIKAVSYTHLTLPTKA